MTRITFGMIVLNGDLFLENVLRNIYPFAHRIVIAEGSVEGCRDQADSRGLSRDRTNEILASFPDPEGRLRVVHGTWPEKDEQCNAYLAEAEGDYLWQVDSDELYREADIERIVRMLTDTPRITSVSFRCNTFFKDLRTVAQGGFRWEAPFHRIIKIHPGARYTTHRPPTILHPILQKSMRDVCPVTAEQMDDAGINLFHYSYVTREQVQTKLNYYLQKPWGFDADYMTRVWDAWDHNRTEVESQFGVHPDQSSDNLPNGTVPFVDSHPEAMRHHPLLEARLV